MRAPRVTKHDAALLEDLRHAVHGLCAPFACGGTLLPDQPITLCFKDQTQLPVRRASNAFEQERQLEPLIARCSPAPFGKGRTTRYDRTIRDALQLKAEGGAFSVPGFDPQDAGILDHIRRELVPQDPSPLTAELSSLNLYARDGHFVPHKDTPRGSDMIGTLVVCLPSQFSNGALVVKHHGILQTFDWATDIQRQKEPTRLHWAAFFGDVDHQIEQVWFGLRVTLTYLLRRGTGSEPLPALAPEAQPSLVQDKLHALLVNRRFLPQGRNARLPLLPPLPPGRPLPAPAAAPVHAHGVCPQRPGPPGRHRRLGRRVGGHLLPLSRRDLCRRNLATRALSDPERATGIRRPAGS